MEYARELHDFVAHHVTAIVAQTKAVRFATASGHAPPPAELDAMLGRIEQAGAEADRLDAQHGLRPAYALGAGCHRAGRHPRPTAPSRHGLRRHRPAGSPSPTAAGAPACREGAAATGLLGPAERIEGAGGRLTAGPVAGSGWRATAELPLRGAYTARGAPKGRGELREQPRTQPHPARHRKGHPLPGQPPGARENRAATMGGMTIRVLIADDQG
ncbi:histidine kinase [Streptomyces oryzae]|uniref:histidine kinase n=1 Tax=Streptomyces oryzae TaxID=1434886 RepID=UPI0035564F27